MSERTESFILCEGYHDRAFWSGMLEHVGCKDTRPTKFDGVKGIARDPFGTPVTGGQFAYHSKTDRFIRIVVAGGKDNVPRLVRTRLEEAKTKPLTRLVICVDSDLGVNTAQQTNGSVSRHEIEELVKAVDPNVTKTPDGDWSAFNGTTTISLLKWSCDDPDAEGIPRKQTLERIICAAIVAVHPDRAPAVHGWLESRPTPPAPDPKEHAWSYLAGWYAGMASYEGFCAKLWGDQKIAAEFVRRLQGSDTWRVAEDLGR